MRGSVASVALLGLVAVVCLARLAACTTVPALRTLPAWSGDKPQPNVYSGYITVDEELGKELFYLLVEADGDPSQKPLIQFQQGGPGCSSLIAAFMEVMFKPVPNDNDPSMPGVSLGDFAWHGLGSVLFVDSPAGVGFSFSKDPAGYQTDNNVTAADTYTFLQRFMELFPALNSTKLIITGESYGGDYGPQLAYEILTRAGEDPHLASQLQGLSLGNPCLSCRAWEEMSSTITIENMYYHAVIPRSAVTQWERSGCAVPNPPSDPCDALYATISNMTGPNFDPDDLYTNPFTGNASLGVGPTPPTSIQEDLKSYLNRKDVQDELGVRPTKWAPCCAEVGQSGEQCELNYTNHWTDMTPYWEYLFGQWSDQVAMQIYSGDVDIATVPYPYTSLCIDSWGLTPSKAWRPWVINSQTAGYVTEYDEQNFRFVTLKGAGHEAPLFQPHAAYLVLETLIGSSPLPSYN